MAHFGMAIALVTGCSSGIGFATALRLASDGFEVVATMRRPERDGAALQEAAAKQGSSVEVVALDVDDDDSVAAAFERAGAVDVLVNNAGCSVYAAAEEARMADWRQMFETNVFGVLRCMQAALPGMRARGSGCIVNIGSLFGTVFFPGTSGYAATKAAIEALSEVAAIEGRPHGIRVVLVQPGATRTALGEKADLPTKTSAYWATTRNTLMFLGAAFADPSEPDVIADAISTAIAQPDGSFRVAAGHWSAETIDLRRQQADDPWIALMSAPTRIFVEQYRAQTGVDLAP
jgi:NAD(P)-dependent dehydrogenase (short-subunit alcohol dehydrogenase family)